MKCKLAFLSLLLPAANRGERGGILGGSVTNTERAPDKMQKRCWQTSKRVQEARVVLPRLELLQLVDDDELDGIAEDGQAVEREECPHGAGQP